VSRPRITGIVLAGGRSARFGSNKLAAELDGTTLLARAIDRLGPIVDDLVVAGPAPGADERHSVQEPRVVPDAEPFPGPLVALAGALASAGGSQAIVVAGDMPDLVAAVLRSMLDRLDADPAVDAVTLESTSPRRQVLPLAVRVAAGLDAARIAVDSGDRSLIRLIDRLTVGEVPLADWLPLDPRSKTLRDVDTPADLERLRDPGMR
jgi:molybdopterin-guanine dinucleotide biosynthesis protein A